MWCANLLIYVNAPIFKIIWLSNRLTLSVPDDGYSRNVSCELFLISMFLLLIISGNYITNG